MKRRDVKEKHEESVLASFQKFLKSKGIDFTIVEKPEPPDAIILLGNRKSWIEITDAFLNGDLARSITSSTAEDVPHIPATKNVVLNPDELFIEKVREVVSKKYDKESISHVFKQYGSGILLVGLYSPFVGEKEMLEIISTVRDIKNENDKRFEKIYLYNEDHVFYEVQ